MSAQLQSEVPAAQGLSFPKSPLAFAENPSHHYDRLKISTK
jgi:hypothetical protein